MIKLDLDYYKNNLTSSEKIVYEQILHGVRNHMDSIKVSNLESNSYEKVMHAVLMDHPRFFHFNSGNISHDGRNILFIPRYTISGVEHREQLSECVDEIKQISMRMKVGDVWEALIWLHSDMMDRIQYRDNGMPSHTIVGPLLNGMGVCEGIAKTVKSICDEMFIPCVVIEGKARQGQTLVGRHAWNAIYAGGAWNFYDFTFDITIQQNNPCMTIERYDYFCTLRTEMEKDHFEWSAGITDDGKIRDYFKTNNLYVNTQKELVKQIKGPNNKDFAFKIGEQWKDFEVSKALNSAINDYVKDKNTSQGYTYSYNDSQRVVYVHLN